LNALLNDISIRNSNVHFINPFKAVCDEENTCQTIFNGKNIFYDSGHLSAFGSDKIWTYIEKTLNDASKLESKTL
jgi:hypothetical protein